MKDLIIIGGGAAGCSAGIYAARKKLNAILIAKDFTGQTGISSWVENYLGMGRISGLALAQKFKEHLKIFDLEIKSFEEVLHLSKINNGFEVQTDENIYQSKSIIIATGSIPKKLNAQNEEKFIGKGISYCVTCDETAFENKTVAVIGAGNAGLEAAIELTRFAKKIYVLEYLEKSNADGVLMEEGQKLPQIGMIYNAEVKAFEGEQKLEKIIYQDRNNKEQKTIMINGCFIEIGSTPNTDFCKELVSLNKTGEIIVNSKTMETSCEGVFACGDTVESEDKQAIIAAGQGAIAALSAFKFLTQPK